MSKIEKQYGYAELKDGTEWTGVRVTFATKVAYERFARANGIDAEAQPFTVTAFWSWHAAKTAGLTDLTWVEFNEQVIDAGTTDQADDEDDQEIESVGHDVTGERPTQGEASTDTPSA